MECLRGTKLLKKRRLERSGASKYQINVPNTTNHKMFETNSSCQVKERTTGKV